VNPLRIRATNYRTFRHLEVELPDGCVAVLGENGAGKSSIVNVIDYALFGAESRSLAELLTDDGVATDLELELTFEHAGETYRVRRGYSAKGRGKTTVDLELWKDAPLHTGDDTGPEWEPLTCESGRETDALICRIIGLTRTTFRASAFLAQGDGAAFTDCPPAKRKEVLAEVLGLDVWQQMRELAKADGRIAASELQRLAGETAQARELAGERPTAESALRDEQASLAGTTRALEEAEAKIADLAERYRAAAETAGKRQAVEAELAAATAELQRLEQANAHSQSAAAQLRITRDELKTLPTSTSTDELVERETVVVAAIDAHRSAVEQHESTKRAAEHAETVRQSYLSQASAAAAAADAARAKVEALEKATDVQHCETCGQTLADEARGRAIASYIEEARQHDQVARTHTSHAANVASINVLPAPTGEPPTAELAAVRAQLATAHQQAQQRARLEERIRTLEREITREPELAERIANAAALANAKQTALDDLEPVDLDTIKREGEQARSQVTALRNLREAQMMTVTRLAARVERIVDADRQLAAAAERVTVLEAEVDLCARLERSYGRDGIPALVIENTAVPSIETEAARILTMLGGSTASCRVELRTQAERKTTDGLRDTLDVIIVGEQGERAYETFSGGERTRINLALRIALARLLAHRRGAESRLLAIDEPEFLDEQGTGALVDVLRSLDTDFSRIYLISHVPALRDSFDDVLTVVKDGDRSHVERAGGEGGVPAAVAA
jgi:exonuclease SbcC